MIRKGLLPFMGGLQKLVPFMLEAAAEVAPRSEWRDWRYHDITCGSCSGGAVFQFYGMSVTMNDLAFRSYLSARAIFGPSRSKRPVIEKLIELAAGGTEPLNPLGKKRAIDLVPGYLHPKACDIFDALFWAYERGDVSEDEGFYYKFLAIRWVLANKNYMYFIKLPTEDLKQLALQGPWAKVAKIVSDPLPALLQIAHDVDHLNHAVRSSGARDHAQVHMDDCTKLVKELPFDRPSITGLNPPTIGDATFKQSNRVLDALIYNEWQPIEDDELPADLWRHLVCETAAHIPDGHFFFNYAGDGALTWDEAHEVHKTLGEIVKTYTFERKPGQIAGCVLVRKG